MTGIHLVGSIPLADAETVFRTVASALGPHLATLPDGETGVRKDWIAWQYAVLARTPGLEPIPVGDRGYLRRQLVRLDGTRDAPALGALGYADAAIASYATFARLQQDGVIPAAVRFQVSLPTPLAPLTVFVAPGDRARVEPAYQAALLGELAQICAAIPHDRLAIQWDVAVEVALVDAVFPAHFAEVERGVRDRLAALLAAVPRDVALGVHLCYGDFGHRHFADPPDAGTLLRLAMMLFALDRPLAWLHLPVPRAWTAPAAYAPLAALTVPAATALYLGVVHMTDGLEGARARLDLARAALAPAIGARIGAATECGWGRRPPETIDALIALHAAIVRA
ncbi:MAG: hypothetical protein K8W52_40865 [Deltaproteobacteria bacterium]|nr:hypothetical protein [Deltaproteobacteria bacterium]